MPSGAKKRKAAKKKKEKEAIINPSTNNSQGNEDLKSQDEKGSDSGDLSTPTFQGHHNRSNPFNGGKEELDQGDPPPEWPFVAGNPSIKEAPSNTGATEKTGSQDDVINVERGLKSEDDFENKYVSIENLGFAKGRRDRDDRRSHSSTSSSSSSSEDKSQVTKKKSDENSSVSKTNLSDEAPVNMSHEEAICVTENAPVKESLNLFGETSDDVNSVKPEVSMSEETIFVAENSVVSNVPVSKFKEGEEKLLHMVEQSTLPSVALTDSGLKENKDKVPVVLPQSETNEGKISEPSGVSASEARNGVEHVGDSDTPEYLENRPLVTPRPQLVQRTSVLSCCGLFDVFSGSNK